MADGPDCTRLRAQRTKLEDEITRLETNPPMAEQLDQLDRLLKELQQITGSTGESANTTAEKLKAALEKARQRYPGIPKDLDKIGAFVGKYGKSLGEMKKFLDVYAEIVAEAAKAQLAFDEGRPADQIEAFANHIHFLRGKLPEDSVKAIPGMGEYLDVLEQGVRSFKTPVKGMQDAQDRYDAFMKEEFGDKSIRLPTARELSLIHI